MTWESVLSKYGDKSTVLNAWPSEDKDALNVLDEIEKVSMVCNSLVILPSASVVKYLPSKEMALPPKIVKLPVPLFQYIV